MSLEASKEENERNYAQNVAVQDYVDAIINVVEDNVVPFVDGIYPIVGHAMSYVVQIVSDYLGLIVKKDDKIHDKVGNLLDAGTIKDKNYSVVIDSMFEKDNVDYEVLNLLILKEDVHSKGIIVLDLLADSLNAVEGIDETGYKNVNIVLEVQRMCVTVDGFVIHNDFMRINVSLMV